MRKHKFHARRHIETELTAIQSAPPPSGALVLARCGALLTDYAHDLSADETLWLRQQCAIAAQAGGQWLEALRHARRGIEQAARTERLRERVALLTITAEVQQVLGNSSQAVRAAREAISLAEPEKLLPQLAGLLVLLGGIYAELGLHEAALAQAERVAALVDGTVAPTTAALAAAQAALACARLGRQRDAQTRIATALRWAQSVVTGDVLPQVLLQRADMAAIDGHYDSALADADAALAQLRALPASSGAGAALARALLATARWLQAQRRSDDARARLDALSSLPGTPAFARVHEDAAALQVAIASQGDDPAQLRAACAALLTAREQARAVALVDQRIAVQFVDELEPVEPRGRRQSAVVSELTLRLLASEAEAQKMARQVARDPVTGALNRQNFEAALAALAAGPAQPVALMIVDIDDFQAIELHCGGVAADTVLAGVHDRLRRALRLNDIVGRGDVGQFLVLSPAVGPRTGAAIAERALAQIGAQPIHCDGEAIAATVAIGVACAASQTLGTLPYLLKRAEAAAQRARQLGKNRAVTVRVIR